jgi:hypothetical protein
LGSQAIVFGVSFQGKKIKGYVPNKVSKKNKKKKTRTSVKEFYKENCLRINPQAMLSTRFLEVF